MLPVPIYGMEASRAASEVIGLRQNLELELGAVVVHGEDDNPAAGAAQVPSARSVGFAVQIVPVGNLRPKPFGIVELFDALPRATRRGALVFHRFHERLGIELGVGEDLSRIELVARTVSRFAHRQSLKLAIFTTHFARSCSLHEAGKVAAKVRELFDLSDELSRKIFVADSLC